MIDEEELPPPACVLVRCVAAFMESPIHVPMPCWVDFRFSVVAVVLQGVCQEDLTQLVKWSVLQLCNACLSSITVQVAD